MKEMKASSLTRRGEEDETGLPRYILSTSKWCKGIWGGPLWETAVKKQCDGLKIDQG